MEPDQKVLDSIAEAVADGDEIDWNALIDSHPQLADSIRNLQRIGSFSESFQRTSDQKPSRRSTCHRRQRPSST